MWVLSIPTKKSIGVFFSPLNFTKVRVNFKFLNSNKDTGIVGIKID